jgi:phenylacetate-CoA ligase
MPGLLERAYWNAFVLWHARNEMRLPYLPRERILDIQSRRVRTIVKLAYDTVPFYRDVMDAARLRPIDFQSAADLSKLPLINSEQLARSPERFLSRRFARSGAFRLNSSGTVGSIKPVYHDYQSLMLALAHGHRQRVVLARYVGRTFGYREMTINRLDGTAAKLRDFYATHSIIPRRLDYSRSMVPPSKTVEEIIASINGFGPDVLYGYGSYLGLIFCQAKHKNLKLLKPLIIVYGGDLMTEPNKRLIEGEFRSPVLSTYQAVESLRIAFQCEERKGFHLCLDQVAVRVVNKYDEPVSNGEPGDIVISNLTNRATVLLNYKLGDIVTWSDQPCACGRTLPMIEKIQGRADDCFILPDGRIIDSAMIIPRLQSIEGIVQVQSVQTGPSEFQINAATLKMDWENTKRELDRCMRTILGQAIVVEIRQVDVIQPEPNGKVRAMVSYCKE